MKKSVAAYWVFAISIVIVNLIVNAEAKAQILDRSLSFREIVSQFQSPEDIAHYLWRNFLFEPDQSNFGQEEYWQSPEEFLDNRKGDCEDFAIFANEALKAKGYTSFLLNIYGSSFSHTVAVFRENGKFNVIDGTDVIRFEAESLKELTSDIYPYWKEAAIVAPSKQSNNGRVLTQFEKKMKAQRALAISV